MELVKKICILETMKCKMEMKHILGGMCILDGNTINDGIKKKNQVTNKSFFIAVQVVKQILLK